MTAVALSCFLVVTYSYPEELRLPGSMPRRILAVSFVTTLLVGTSLLTASWLHATRAHSEDKLRRSGGEAWQSLRPTSEPVAFWVFILVVTLDSLGDLGGALSTVEGWVHGGSQYGWETVAEILIYLLPAAVPMFAFLLVVVHFTTTPDPKA